MTAHTGWHAELTELARRRERGRQMGGAAAIERLHARGKLTPRERIDLLLDAGSFREFGELATGVVRVAGRPDRPAPADALVTGWGSVHGRTVLVMADDGTIAAGARGPAGYRKARFIDSLCVRTGLPLIMLQESSASRLGAVMGAQFAGPVWPAEHGVPGTRTHCEVDTRGPLISAVLGTALGAASFRTVNADFAVMVESSAMALAGPPMVKGAIGHSTSVEELGSPDFHRSESGLIDLICKDEPEALSAIRSVVSYLPERSGLPPRRVESHDPGDRAVPELLDIVPVNHRKAYDVVRVIEAIVDDHQFVQLKPERAPNIVVGFARLAGHAVGVVANQPIRMGGVVDPRAAGKATRFAQVCGSFGLPLVFLQDQPGFIVGASAEREGALREVVRLMNTAYGLRTPVVTVLMRKAFGFSTWLLGGKVLDPELVVAWPGAAVSVAGPELALNTLLATEQREGSLDEERRAELAALYVRNSRAQLAAYEFRIDDVIHPAETRRALARALDRGERRYAVPRAQRGRRVEVTS